MKQIPQLFQSNKCLNGLKKRSKKKLLDTKKSIPRHPVENSHPTNTGLPIPPCVADLSCQWMNPWFHGPRPPGGFFRRSGNSWGRLVVEIPWVFQGSKNMKQVVGCLGFLNHPTVGFSPKTIFLVNLKQPRIGVASIFNLLWLPGYAYIYITKNRWCSWIWFMSIRKLPLKTLGKVCWRDFLQVFFGVICFIENLFKNWAISSTRKPNDISKCLGYWGAQGLDHLPSIQRSFQGLHDVSYGCFWGVFPPKSSMN